MMRMWSSSNLAGRRAEHAAEPYVYPPVLCQGQGGNGNSPHTDPSTRESLWSPGLDPQSSRGISEDQIRAREKQAREEGLKEGEARARTEFEKALSVQRESVVRALQDFAREREAYFGRVEAEVVRLALGIARKILHREAQVDPLLLAGVVRVGLEKVAAGTRVRLRVHPDEVKLWQEFFAQQPNLQLSVELMGDASLGQGHCLLETELGSTDLTLETQLKEIEQGFFDLLAQRPQKLG